MKKRLFLLWLICLHPFSIPVAAPAAFSGLYVFGDSLSDSGQYPDIFAGHRSLRATNRMDPLNPRSETALVWSQYFSQYLGLGPLLPSDPLLGTSGNNYAVVKYTADKIRSSITDRYLVREPVATPWALYVVWGGGNDVLNARNSRASGGDAAQLITDSARAADDIVAGIEALWKTGGRYILVPNLPHIGDIPESYLLGSEYIAAGNEATRVFNSRLLSRLNASGINAIQADIGSFIAEMIADPGAFGFSTENHKSVAFDGASFTKIPAAEGVNGAGTAAPDPSRYIFFDGIHPTTYAADIIAQYYLSILTAPGRISILAQVPLHLGRTHGNVIDHHLQYVQSGGRKGQFIPFVAGGYDLFREDDTDCTGYDSRQYGLTGGFSYGVSNNWRIGAAGGHHSGTIDIAGDSGESDMDALFLSLLTGYRYHKLALNAIFSIADLDYSNITRKLRLGPLLRTHEAETGGDYKAVKVSLSLDLFNRDGFTLGPLSSLSYQHIHVNSFGENGHLSTGMRFQDQHRRSLWVRAGLFASHETDTSFGKLHVRGDAGYEKECKDGQQSLRAGLITLPGSSFELPLPPPEKNFWLFNLGVGLRVAAGWEYRITYHLTLGSETGIDQGAQLSIQAAF